ncbi:MAG: electron transport complex subunit RsxE [Clostridium sp.]|jgi:electron transport complex protein RnfE|uniref:electron transport complex subunit RsxE n=1 Tax=Clostridium sp. TaxID=1506 RepID=UPI0025C16D24|nr:electron transport complex subunit RsxE [Clostridium sp.]MCH3963227.1 electron transport complex subunit RsxE [Clostridium sp.]MCI1717199.1 electron transport complex subunit RsxE [Clostridium sp.]MCI1801539.1 electron transport complex subunit RsxE [Clostridium sp.]MCI1815385.1 electron transport complex subunit RsxE [Clostridium sp.]MCI1872288.1 electron transport complex subunit RsxE [Clostridium sp.]
MKDSVKKYTGRELWGIFEKGIVMENPIFVLALSLCPALAVTGEAATALTMGLSVMFVITANNTVVSIIRNFVNAKVRVPVYITSIATIVTMVELVLQAFAPLLYKKLGIYLALVVVFAIILARAEVFASKNSIFPSFLDGLGMGTGFCFALVIIGIIRELFGMGSIFGFKVLGAWYNPALIMILPPGGFILIGYLVAIVKVHNQRQEKLKISRGEL